MQVPDHKVADVTINVDRIAGRRALESRRVVREDENEEAIGGRNAVRAVDWVPGWNKLVS